MNILCVWRSTYLYNGEVNNVGDEVSCAAAGARFGVVARRLRAALQSTKECNYASRAHNAIVLVLSLYVFAHALIFVYITCAICMFKIQCFIL